MTKKLKLKVKIFGDDFYYLVTGYDEREEVSVYDTRDGNHLKFSWDTIQGFISENSKLIAQQQVKNLNIPAVSNRRELLCAFFKFFRDNGDANIGMTIEQFVDAFLSTQ